MRSIVSVATGEHFVKGLDRLTEWCAENHEDDYVTFRGALPPNAPAHQDIPYGFKPYAMYAAAMKASTLLWCDASMIPVKPLDRVWEQIERDGYLVFENGYSNYEWTADSAYPELFPERTWVGAGSSAMAIARDDNRKIRHVVGGCVGVDLTKQIGRDFLAEWYRLAKTRAFCGPWHNANYLGDGWPYAVNPPRLAPCGPPDVRGHRHDQSSLSVIAWRLDCKLTQPPDIFSYGKLGETCDERTVILADGNY